jgi:hypothetical protein
MRDISKELAELNRIPYRTIDLEHQLTRVEQQLDNEFKTNLYRLKDVQSDCERGPQCSDIYRGQRLFQIFKSLTSGGAIGVLEKQAGAILGELQALDLRAQSLENIVRREFGQPLVLVWSLCWSCSLH